MQFGGTWTAEKLERVRKYLVAYATIFNKNRHYKFAYIDAFAGSGSWQVDEDIADEDATSLRAGSAQIALKVEPKFDTYIFIEKSREAAGANCKRRPSLPRPRRPSDFGSR